MVAQDGAGQGFSPYRIRTVPTESPPQLPAMPTSQQPQPWPLQFMAWRLWGGWGGYLSLPFCRGLTLDGCPPKPLYPCPAQVDREDKIQQMVHSLRYRPRETTHQISSWAKQTPIWDIN